MTVLDTDFLAAHIQAELMDSGNPVNILGVLIAGIVKANNEEVFTKKLAI